MKVITIDPRPAQKEAMIELLMQSAPVVGIEFTLKDLAHLMLYNIDPQHSSITDTGTAAIEIAARIDLPSTNVTYAVVRADPDALGTIATLEIRRDGNLSEETLKRIAYIAKYDSFAFGAWPGPQDPEELQLPDRTLFVALTALCMDFKKPILERIELMRQWLTIGDCNGLTNQINKSQGEALRAYNDTRVISNDGTIVVLQAHTIGAVSIAYCYAPVAIIANDEFSFPGVEGKHLKYTICQFEAGKYANLVGAVKALNALEENGSWGGSPAIIGSPQGVSSSLSLEQVSEVVREFLF